MISVPWLADMSTNMALFSQAGMLGIRPKLFAGPPERFEADDFYRWDTSTFTVQRIPAVGITIIISAFSYCASV